jgi:hypothetical protein
MKELQERHAVPGKYRSGCSHLSIGWNIGPPMEQLEKVPKELKAEGVFNPDIYLSATDI